MTDQSVRSREDSNPPAATEDASTPEMAALQADIARTREELAHTVDQLAAKLDVKTRLRNRLTGAKGAAALRAQALRNRVVDADGRARPAALSVGAGVVAAVTAMLLVRLWVGRPRRRGRRFSR